MVGSSLDLLYSALGFHLYIYLHGVLAQAGMNGAAVILIPLPAHLGTNKYHVLGFEAMEVLFSSAKEHTHDANRQRNISMKALFSFIIYGYPDCTHTRLACFP